MLSVESKVIRIEKLIHDTATDSRQWPVFLNELKESLGASVVILAKSDFKNNESRIFHVVGIDYEFVRSYEALVRQNPWLQRDQWYVNGRIRKGEDIYSQEALTKTQFYKEWLLPQNLFYAVFAIVKEIEGQIFYLLALRSQKYGCFEDNHLRLLENLMPHLQQASRRGEYLWQLAIILDVFDSMQFAVMVVDKWRRLLFSNRITQELLNGEDTIQIRDGRVWLNGHHNAKKFSKAISRAASGIEQGGPNPVGKVIMVARGGKKLPLWVVVSSLNRRLRKVVCQEDEVALVYLISPERISKISETKLRSLFDLTYAEQNLAKLILEGHRLDEAAKHLGISINTARAHMKRIYAKTDTGRQADLVRLFLTSPSLL